MKFALLVYSFLLVTMFACKNSTEVNSKEITFEESKLQSKNPKIYLIGNWAICSDGNEKGVTQYNICPEILFGKNNTARLFYSSTLSESLSWSTNDDTLYLNHIAYFGKDTSQVFKDVKYLLQKTEDSSSVYLTFVGLVSNNYFNLSRSKFKTIKNLLYD